MPSSTEFIAYMNALIRLGHDRHWLRRNEVAMRERFKRDPSPFPPGPPPSPRARDRYEEI